MRVQPEQVPTSGRRQGNSSSAQLEDQLREANGFLKQIGDWLVAFAKTYKHAIKSLDMAQAEVDGAARQTAALE